jgi:hypothetical protein
MIGRYSRCTAVWYASARTIARGKTRPRRKFSAQSRHASEYLVRQVSLGRKAPATKHYVSPPDYDVARVYMNILASNSKRVNIRVFLSFFLSLLLAFFIFYFDSRRLDRSVVPYSRSLIQRDQDSESIRSSRECLYSYWLACDL